MVMAMVIEFDITIRSHIGSDCAALHPQLRIMVPPPRDTPEYRTYLDKQNKRKKDQRKKTKIAQKAKQAKPIVKRALAQTLAQLRNATETADTLRVRSNAHLRGKQKAEARAKAFEETNQELHKLLLAERKKTKAAEQRQAVAEVTVAAWETWWQRLTSRAPNKLLKQLPRLTRPPRPAAPWSYCEQ